MTATRLLTLIALAWLVQLAVGVGVALWRRRGIEGDRRVREVGEAGGGAASSSTAAWPGWRDFKVVRREIEDRAGTQCSFYLEPTDGEPLPTFRPGQFLTFSLQVADDVPLPGAATATRTAPRATRTITRCYSLSHRPEAKHYRVTIKRVPSPEGRVDAPPGLASNHFHDEVAEGAVLKVKAPAGHFFIDAEADVPAVLVAGGIGITPMMSMLRWCLAEQPGRPLHLFYGLRHGGEHAFKAALEQLARQHGHFLLHVAYSQPGYGDVQGRDYQHAGRVDVDLLRRTLPHGRHQFYVCGPPAMMQTLVPALAQWGVPRADLHFEAFGPATVRLPGGEAGEAPAPAGALLEVRFSRSARTLVWDGQDANLLDFAERHGVAVESGCRSGGCGSCETRLASGEVRYGHRPDHDVAPGHCLLCVGRPGSALVLEA